MRLHKLLRFVGAVERPTLRIIARASVVAPDDNIVGAVIAADNGVPQGLARAAHAHRQRQQREQHPFAFVIVVDQGTVGTHAGVMIDVARPRHADYRMQQQHAVYPFNGAFGQFLMRTVQRIARLKGDDVAMAVFLQQGARFGRRAPQKAEILMRRHLQHPQSSCQVLWPPAMHLGNQRVTRVEAAEDFQ